MFIHSSSCNAAAVSRDESRRVYDHGVSRLRALVEQIPDFVHLEEEVPKQEAE